MPASVVALSVQTGSGGFTVSRQVSDRLDFRYYDWEITSEAAARAGVSPTDVIAAEHVPGFFERMMRRLGAASTVTMEGGGGLAEPSPDLWATAFQSLDSDEYRPFIEKFIMELADVGQAVVVGHAGQYILKDRPSVLKVLIYGSPERRAERLAVEQELDPEQALANVSKSDKDRHDLLKKLYKFDWLDVSTYDLAINTDVMGEPTAVEAVVLAANGLP